MNKVSTIVSLEYDLHIVKSKLVNAQKVASDVQSKFDTADIEYFSVHVHVQGFVSDNVFILTLQIKITKDAFIVLALLCMIY